MELRARLPRIAAGDLPAWTIVLPPLVFVVLAGFRLELLGLAAGLALCALPFAASLRGQLTMLFAALPLQYVGFDAGFANLGPFDAVALVFVVSTAGRMLFGAAQGWHIPRPAAVALLMFLSFVPSMLFTAAPAATIKASIRLLLWVLTAVGIADALRVIGDPRLPRRLMLILVAETVLLTLVGLYQTYTESSLVRIIATRAMPTVFEDVNFWAGFLLLSFALAPALAATARGRFRTLLLLGAAGLLAMGVIMTVSRAALITLGFIAAVTTVVLAASATRGRWFLAGSMVVALVAGIGVLISPLGSRVVNLVSVTERFETTLTGQDRSVTERAKLLGIALATATDNPVTGVGFGAFEKSFSAYRGARTETGVERSVHNTWLRVAAESGVIGAAGALAFVLSAIGWVRRTGRAVGDPAERMLFWSLVIALAGYGIMSFTLDQLTEAHPWVVFGLLLGAGEVFTKVGGEPPTERR